MSDEKNVDSEKGSEKEVVKKTSDVVIIGGEAITIVPLKAGKYFEAQKSFLKIIGESQKMNVLDDESDNVSGMISAFSAFPEEMAKVVAIGTGMDLAMLLDRATPSEVPEAFGKVVELNDFSANLKKYVAPFQSLGGVE